MISAVVVVVVVAAVDAALVVTTAVCFVVDGLIVSPVYFVVFLFFVVFCAEATVDADVSVMNSSSEAA